MNRSIVNHSLALAGIGTGIVGCAYFASHGLAFHPKAVFGCAFVVIVLAILAGCEEALYKHLKNKRS